MINDGFLFGIGLFGALTVYILIVCLLVVAAFFVGYLIERKKSKKPRYPRFDEEERL